MQSDREPETHVDPATEVAPAMPYSGLPIPPPDYEPPAQVPDRPLD